MSVYLRSLALKKGFLASILLISLLAFGYLPDKAQGEHITLVTSEQHRQMGEKLREILQPRLTVELLILPLTQLAEMVAKSETDFFVISMGDIYYVMELTRINLVAKGGAVAPADVAEKVHLTTLAKTGIRDIEDLAYKLPDKPVSLGPENSATEAHANDSIEAQRRAKGLDDFRCEDKGGRIKCQNDRFDEQARKLLREEVKAYYVTGEVPIPSVEEIAETNKLELAAIPENVVDEMNKITLINKFIPTTIDMNRYRTGSNKVPTAGIPAAVAATDRVDEKTVWIVTEILVLENPFISLEALPAALGAIRSFMRFHPTSLVVFKECGVNVEP